MNREPNWDDGGPTPWDVDEKFRAWINVLDEEIIQGEYGYEPGEFTVCAEHWHEHYRMGLTPAQSFRRALDAFAEDRRQRESDKRQETPHMITETLTLNFRDEAQQKRFHDRLNTPEQFTAKDVLLYLFSDCKRWCEDVDGDAHDDGTPYTIVNHDVRISDAHLSELMDMAGIDAGGMMETTLERLKRANDEDLAETTSKNNH